MGHSNRTTKPLHPVVGDTEGSPGGLAGSEWESEAFERIDDRDAENIDLDIECINEALERKHRS